MPNQVHFPLRGGLGNQLFIVASAVNMSLEKQCPIVFLDLEYLRDKKRISQLNFFNLKANQVYLPQIKGDQIVFEALKNEVLPANQVINYWGRRYSSLFTELYGGTVVVNGYFQSEKFFYNISPYFLNYINSILQKYEVPRGKTVFQIRLGDLARERDIRKIYGFLGDNYWIKALALFQSEITNIVITTDDKDGISKYLPHFFDLIIKHEIKVTNFSEYESLAIMAKSNNRVISNSTFGWWGAYLANQGKTIAPKNWYSGLIERLQPNELNNIDWYQI